MMQKAMRLKAAKNLDPAGTKCFDSSFIKYSNARISSNLGSIGVSLGRGSNDILLLANVLRHLEHERLTVSPKASTRPETHIVEEDEVDDILDGRLLSALVGGISEVDLEQSGLDSFYDLKASRRNSKSSSKKRKNRRTVLSTKSKIVFK
jgi:hypothetical protein